MSWVRVQQLAPKQAVGLSRDVQDALKYEEMQQNHTVVARHPLASESVMNMVESLGIATDNAILDEFDFHLNLFD